jgi:hypothetical protein
MNSTCCDQRIEYVKYQCLILVRIFYELLVRIFYELLVSQDILPSTSQDILQSTSQDILRATSQDILLPSIISGLQAIIHSSLLYLSVGIMDSLH